MQHPFITIAISAAREAGDLILQARQQLDSIQIFEKGHNDFVTEIDRLAEQTIIKIIRKAYPDHSILGEESGLSEGKNDKADYLWIIDPLDGTNNFIHGFPHFAVSIAVKHKNKIEHGVIFDPIRNDLFIASRGSGAQLNNRRIRVAKRKSLEQALIGTGFHNAGKLSLDDFLAISKRFLEKGLLRRAGSAALDLAYVAAGQLDGFWEMGLKPWDIAAGSLLIKEAGGLVGDWNGGENFEETGDIVAGNPKLFKAILQTVNLNSK